MPAAFDVPLGEEESDGTLTWDSHTLVLVEASAGGVTGLGYSYTHAAAAQVIDQKLRGAIGGVDVMRIGAAWQRMHDAVRNLGRPGICAAAVSAVDNALWDLKARVLGLSWPISFLAHMMPCPYTAAAASPPTPRTSSNAGSRSGSIVACAW